MKCKVDNIYLVEIKKASNKLAFLFLKLYPEGEYKFKTDGKASVTHVFVIQFVVLIKCVGVLHFVALFFVCVVQI